MNVLDATFLIDYHNGVEATREFYQEHGCERVRWIVLVPTFAEVLVGDGSRPDGDIIGASEDLGWTDVEPVGTRVVTMQSTTEVEVDVDPDELNMLTIVA